MKEVVILAGGLGTRLRSMVSHVPKVLAPIGENPFLYYLIRYLIGQGFTRFVFSLGYQHEKVVVFLNNYFPYLSYDIVIEKEPLGTGGAIQLALLRCKESNVFIVNGDSFFKVDIASMYAFHIHHQSACTMALKRMREVSRYGIVEWDAHTYRIESFKEKQLVVEGWISGGYMWVQRNFLDEYILEAPFSIEQDVFMIHVKRMSLFAFLQDNYFIDIGVPDDYQQAQIELPSILQAI